MVENIRFCPKLFQEDDPRKWIFSTIYWYDTKLSHLRQQGVAVCVSLRNCDSLLSHLLCQPDTYLDARHKARFFMRLA